MVAKIGVIFMAGNLDQLLFISLSVFPWSGKPGTGSAGSIGGKSLGKRFSFVSVRGGGEFLPAPSMKEARPHDAQRSAPGSRTPEPIEGYAKFCKLVLNDSSGS